MISYNNHDWELPIKGFFYSLTKKTYRKIKRIDR